MTLDEAIKWLDEKNASRFVFERLPLDPRKSKRRGNPTNFSLPYHYSPQLAAGTVKFIQRPDAPAPVELRILRKERISPLTIIAEKWEDRETFNPWTPQNGLN